MQAFKRVSAPVEIPVPEIFTPPNELAATFHFSAEFFQREPSLPFRPSLVFPQAMSQTPYESAEIEAVTALSGNSAEK